MKGTELRTTITLGVLLIGTPACGFDIVNRWTGTQTDGGGIQRGDAITLLWSIVPDGESYERSSNSDLVGFLDDGWGVSSRFRTPTLNNRPWFTPITDAYDQYGYVSGLTMVYVAEQDSSGADTGLQGDIRIGGEPFDTNPDVNVLADNVFPNGGDMRIDTTPDSFYSSSNPDGFRNLISHESGHGVGLGHTIPTDAESVMEPGIQSHFFGLQFDDVYAFNRLYGDPGEKNGGNDSSGSATSLGVFSSQGSATFGADATDTVVEQFDDDWLGVDGDTDEDWFRFTLTRPSSIDLSVTPIGPTYTTEENGLFVASEQSDLELRLFTSGLQIIDRSDDNGLGGAERADAVLLQPGDYYARVKGKQDSNQFYRLDLDVTVADVVLTIDRDTGRASLASLTPGGAEIDGYGIQSAPGALRPDDGDWLSLADQGEPGWSETAATANELAEASPSGSLQLGEQGLDLGRVYSPVVTEPFGTPHTEDVDFEYSDAGGAGTFSGGVEFVGDPFANNLVLTVDPDTGLALLENESQTTIDLIAYILESDSGSLDAATWMSLEDQGLSGWSESNQSDDRLGELRSAGGTTLGPSESLFLGAPFELGGTQDLELSFILFEDPSLWTGVVRYGAVALPGDYNGDGVVGLGDYDAWRLAFGAAGDSLADGNGDGVVDAIDYAVWREAWQAAQASSTQTVPEPAAFCLVVLGAVAAVSRSSRRAGGAVRH